MKLVKHSNGTSSVRKINLADSDEMVLPPELAELVINSAKRYAQLQAKHFSESAHPKRRLPPIYLAAIVRNTTPIDSAYNEFGMGFDLGDGSTVRLRLDVGDVKRWFAYALQKISDYEARVQSDMSSGRPSSDVSIDDMVLPPHLAELVRDLSRADEQLQARHLLECAELRHLLEDVQRSQRERGLLHRIGSLFRRIGRSRRPSE